MNRHRVKALLVGGDDHVTMLGCLGAVGVFVFGLSLWAILRVLTRLEATIPLDLPWAIGALALVCIVPAFVYAYHNEGLFVCLVMGSAVPLALYLVPTASPTMPPDESVFWGLRAGLMFGLPAGAIGFLVGVGVRYLTGHERPTERGDVP